MVDGVVRSLCRSFGQSCDSAGKRYGDVQTAAVAWLCRDGGVVGDGQPEAEAAVVAGAAGAESLERLEQPLHFGGRDGLSGVRHGECGVSCRGLGCDRDGAVVRVVAQGVIDEVRGQFLAESVLLSSLGGIVGVLIGVGATAGYALTKHWPGVFPPAALAGGVGAAVLVGALAGMYPAMRAARLAPTEALA
jgi:hypothetical protein